MKTQILISFQLITILLTQKQNHGCSSIFVRTKQLTGTGTNAKIQLVESVFSDLVTKYSNAYRNSVPFLLRTLEILHIK